MVACFALALFTLASTWNHGRWGEHGVFIAAYSLLGVYCIWRRVWVSAAAMASLVWLRFDLMEGRAGWELRLASTLFVALLALLCFDRAGDLRRGTSEPDA